MNVYLLKQKAWDIYGDVHIKWIDWYSCAESFMVHLYFANVGIHKKEKKI